MPTNASKVILAVVLFNNMKIKLKETKVIFILVLNTEMIKLFLKSARCKNNAQNKNPIELNKYI